MSPAHDNVCGQQHVCGVGWCEQLTIQVMKVHHPGAPNCLEPCRVPEGGGCRFILCRVSTSVCNLQGLGLVHMLWQVCIMAAAWWQPHQFTPPSAPLNRPHTSSPVAGGRRHSLRLPRSTTQSLFSTTSSHVSPSPPSRAKCCVPARPTGRLAPSSLPEDHRSTHPSGFCRASHTAMACMPHPCRQGGSSSPHLGTPQLQLLWRHLLQQGRDGCFDGDLLLLPALVCLVLLPPFLLLRRLLPTLLPHALEHVTLGPPPVPSPGDLHPHPW